METQREIKFRYFFKQDTKIRKREYTLDALAGGVILEDYNTLTWDIIGKFENVGLWDNKGIEIFTGDIVSWEDFEGFGYEEVRSSGIAIVRYNTDKCRTMFFDPYSDEWYELDDFSFDYVIGNTFENLELLPEHKYIANEGK